MDTYTIPDQNLGKLELHITRLARKAAKLGFEPPVLKVLGSRFIEITLDDAARTKVTRKVHDVQVQGQAPRIEGWDLIAIIDHFSSGERGRNILRQLPHLVEIELPITFRTDEPRCDHCKLERNRHNTFALHNEAGEWMLVGSNCLRDFLGHKSPDALANFYQHLFDLLHDAQDEGWGGGSGTSYIELQSYLARTAAAIEQYGWVSRKRANEEVLQATADLVNDPAGKITVNPEHSDLAKATIQWVRETLAIKESLNDYEWNLVAACAEDYIHLRNIGLAASAIVAYKRAMNLIAEREAQAQRPPSEYVGEIKQRIEIDLKVIRRIDIETDYGRYGSMLRITVMEDETGNILVWKTGSATLDEGESYRIKGTIKAHEEYDGRKQTILTRCQVKCSECGTKLDLFETEDRLYIYGCETCYNKALEARKAADGQ